MKGAIVFTAAAAAAAAPAPRIMPLGDSITQWQCNNESSGGYRNYLGNSIHAAGFNFDFVGSEYGCGNHEGHSGWTVAQLQGIAAGVYAAHTPDIILIQAGTNDLFNYQPGYYPIGANVTGTLARMDALLNTTFTSLPAAHALVSGVTYINATRCANYSSAPWHPPNCPPDMPTWIVELNAALPNLTQAYADRGFNVSFHDPNPECNFVAEDYWIWGIHFTESGFAKIGASWWKHLQPVMEAIATRKDEVQQQQQEEKSMRWF